MFDGAVIPQDFSCASAFLPQTIRSARFRLAYGSAEEQPERRSGAPRPKNGRCASTPPPVLPFFGIGPPCHKLSRYDAATVLIGRPSPLADARQPKFQFTVNQDILTVPRTSFSSSSRAIAKTRRNNLRKVCLGPIGKAVGEADPLEGRGPTCAQYKIASDVDVAERPLR